MDANGTRFHLLSGKADWSPPAVTISAGEDGAFEASWDEERGAVSLAPRVFLPPGSTKVTRNIESRRGAAADRYGNVYRVSDDRTSILVRSSGSGRTSVLWPLPGHPPADPPPAGAFHDAAPGEPDRAGALLSGLAITCHHRLIAGYSHAASGEVGLVVLDLFSAAPPVWLDWPVERSLGHRFEPFDIAPLPDGGALILDRENRRLWGIDARLSALVRPAADAALESPFDPAPGQPEGPEHTSVEPSITELLPLHEWPASADPVAVEVVSRDTAVVLVNRAGERFAAVHVLRPFAAPAPAEVLSTGVVLTVLPPDVAGTFELSGHDMAGTASPGTAAERRARLFVAGASGLQAYAFDLVDLGEAASPRWSLAPSSAYFPMYGYSNRALVVYRERPYHDAGDHWVLLTERPRRRFRRQATITTGIFDSRRPACVWHRVLADGAIPRGSTLRVFTRAAETEAEVLARPWDEEPAPVRRRDGTEIPGAPAPFRAPTALPDETGTFDVLLQRARGRHLQLRIELAGDGTVTPRIGALRLYYPRFSYLERYLPAVYREDPASASFLDRFLSLFEGFYTPIEDRIAAAQALFDVRSAPPEALDWLASWLGTALDPAWDEGRRRLFLRHAADFFRMRGTVRGLVTALELAIGECPGDHLFDESIPLARRGVRVVEKHASRRLPGVIAGDPSEPDGLRELPVTGPWRPSQGREALSLLYRSALASAGVAEEARPEVFPIREPEDGTRELWRTFCKHALGFVPLSGPGDADRWHLFLARRHGTIEALRAGHGIEYTKFEDVPLPVELPGGGALADWYGFEGHLAIARYAHHFVIVLPVRPGDAAGSDAYQERKRLAERIAALEKPAHTTCDVRFYWAMFRVGEARLGTDSLVHADRAADLLGPLVLDRSYLSEGYLAPRPPGDAADRRVLGRDALRARAEET